MRVLEIMAEVIGFAVLAVVFALLVLAIATWVNDQVRMRFPRYDRWLYDETRRWNRRQQG